MKILPLFGLLILSSFLLSYCSRDTANKLPDTVDFNYHIKPILSDRCFACHGPDEKAREAKLALHTEQGAFAALDSLEDRFIIAPGNPEASEVYHRIVSTDPEYMMPPPGSNLSLSEYDIKLITKWIKQGAPWKNHWAFIPPEKPEIPRVKLEGWGDNPIDAFVLQKMKEKGLKPAEEESPEKWLRRVHFDLTGLPPKLQELDSFVKDHSEEAYIRVVDNLLNSKAYGERMASIWLDLSRYADSHGYQDDKPRSIWPWRDWVIQAFNENKPYDQFVTEQLAGDLLPNATYDQKLATAFNRNHAITQEGGVIDEEYRTEYAADRAQTFATSFLGLTLQCARCHDHKYDPISQKEFYELYGFFNSVDGERGQISYFDEAPAPNLQMQDPDYEAYIQEVKSRIARLEDTLLQIINEEKSQFTEWNGIEKAVETIDTISEILADYDLNDQGWKFLDKVTQTAIAMPNLNLPPSVEKPLKVVGKEGQALRFNGDNFVTLGEIGDFEHWSSFSISLWIKHDGPLDKDAAIFGRRNEEQYRQGYDCLLLKSRQLSFRLIHNLNGPQIEVKTKDKLPGGWHHLAVTYDGSGRATGVRLFIDGIQQLLTTVKDDLQGLSIANGNDFLIGHWNHRARIVNNQHGFKQGDIDQVKVYGKQLSNLEIKALTKPDLQLLEQASREDFFNQYLLRSSALFQSLKYTLDSLRTIDVTLPKIMIMKEVDTLIPAFVLDRGVYDAKLELVERNTPQSILPFNQAEKNRLGLAKWLFDERNPLTARVLVNRLWLQCFGNGLVKSAEDFGNQGDLPTHPELLDWLAVEVKTKGWDIKEMLKLMVLSKTYRQSSAISQDKWKVDQDNLWLARGPHQPLTAEMIRDQALSTSGLLYEKVGGKWVKPYQPGGIWKELANQIGENKYRISLGKDKYRRSLYTYWKRTIPPPTMLTLDAPERSVCTIKRQATSTPLQALILLNDPTYLEASRHLATQLVNRYETDIPGYLQLAFTSIVNRYPRPDELSELLKFYDQAKSDYTGNIPEAKALLSIGETPASIFSDEMQGVALTLTISLIYNLDEAKYR